jgi:hypothetical protein
MSCATEPADPSRYGPARGRTRKFDRHSYWQSQTCLPRPPAKFVPRLTAQPQVTGSRLVPKAGGRYAETIYQEVLAIKGNGTDERRQRASSEPWPWRDLYGARIRR